MSDADRAYKAAEQEIENARAAGMVLDFEEERFRALGRLPPEIGALTQLESLDLADTQVTDITPLQGIIRLLSLNLRNTPVDDLTPIQGLTALKKLDLDNTQVADLLPLQGLTALHELDLGNAPVTDLRPLQGLAALVSLHLVNTPVTDLTPLRGLTALQWLHLNNTQVADLRPIADLPRLGDSWLGGLRFRNTPGARATPELTRLSEIGDDTQRTRETLAYLKTLPPWPEPLPWEGTGTGADTGHSGPAQVAQRQIAFLLDHAATSQASALTTADQIRHALRDVPASDGNKLPPVLQTMSDVADVLDRLASAPIGPDNSDREAALTAHIKALEDRVRTLTAQLEDAEAARQAAEALAKAGGFWASYRKAAGTSAAAGTVALAGVAVPTALTYFLGAEHPLIKAFLTVMGRLPK